MSADRARKRLTASVAWLAPAFVLVAFWLVTRPDVGVVHDALLYTLQALHGLHPGELSRDPYLAHGSQDTFTAFSALYGPLIQAVGVPAAHRAGVLIGHALWLAALVAFVFSLFAARQERILALAGAITLHSAYGFAGIFGYGEPFLTPRIFAEASVLAALACALKERWVPAILVLATGAALHPLMTLPGIGAVWLLATRREPRLWMLAGIAACLVVAFATLGIEPFARLRQQFDGEWWAVVRERNVFALVLEWYALDWWRTAAAALALSMALCVSVARERAVIAAVAMTAVVGVVATAIGGDLARNVLMVNLQPWRALWPMTMLANALLPVVILRLAARQPARHIAIMALIVALLERWVMVAPIISTAFLVLALIAILLELRRDAPLPILARVALLFPAVMLLAFAVASAFIAAPAAAAVATLPVFAVSGVVLLLGFMTLLASAGERIRAPRTVLLAASGVLCAATVSVDRRSPWDRFAVDADIPDGLAEFVADAGDTYWQGGIALQWVKLRMPSAFSCLHGSGAMFYRATAMDYARRAAALAILNTADDFELDARRLCPLRRHPDETGPRDRAPLIAACDALPGLDTIILAQPVADAVGRRWVPPAQMRLRVDGTDSPQVEAFHAYRCTDLQEGRPPS